MIRKRQIEKAAHEYINSDAVPTWKLAEHKSILDAIIELWRKIPQIRYAFFGLILGEIFMGITLYILIIIRNILGI